MARRAGHTVNEGDGAANPRWDWTDNNPMLEREAEHSSRIVAKSAGESVNEYDDDGVRERKRDWFEDMESEEEEAEDVMENRLDRYLDAVEKDAKAVLEHVRVLKGEEKEEEEVDRYEEKQLKKVLLEQMRVLKGEKKEEVERYKRILIESI